MGRLYTLRIWAGVVLVISSAILGSAVKVNFTFHYLQGQIHLASVIWYIISWIMVGIGAVWVGKEYYTRLKRYVSYKHYRESLKRGAKKASEVARKKIKKRRK